MRKVFVSKAAVLATAALLSAQWMSPVHAATLFTTDVVDGANWQGSMLSDGGNFAPSQDITLSSSSDIDFIQWTGRYCFLDGSGCLKTGYETLVDDFHVRIDGVTTYNQTVSRSADLNWSGDSAVLEYTLSLADLILGPGTYTVSIWNELASDPVLAWYWNFGGDSGEALSITIDGTAVSEVPLPLSGLLLFACLGVLGLVRPRRDA